MKVCVTAKGRDESCLVDPRFGRAARILLVDTDTNEVRCLEDVTPSSHGAGVLLAQNVIYSGASAVITGQIGPRAYDVLTAAGIEVYLARSGTVADAVQDLCDGRLEKLVGPTAARHAGMQS